MFYVYVHRKASNGDVFYVGKGKGKRFKSTVGRSQYWNRVAEKYGFVAEILFDEMSERDAFDCEKKIIKYYREEFSLVNMTDGGEGACGAVRSDETRRKISVAHTGLKRTPIVGAKISEALSNKDKLNFINLSTGEIFNLTRKQFRDKCGFNRDTTKSICSGFSAKGFALVDYVDVRSFYDKLTFENVKTGVIEKCTRKELRLKYNLTLSQTKSICSDKTIKNKWLIKGWRLVL